MKTEDRFQYRKKLKRSINELQYYAQFDCLSKGPYDKTNYSFSYLDGCLVPAQSNISGNPFHPE